LRQGDSICGLTVMREGGRVRGLAGVCARCANVRGGVLIILGVARGLTGDLGEGRVPMAGGEGAEAHVRSRWVFLLAVSGALIIAGCMMDIFSATVVVVPLILPIAERYGVDPVHLGIIFLANLVIGYSTPPVGINLFIASQRFGRPVLSLFRATVPFLVLMLLWLGLVTYIPAISLWWQN